MNANQKGALAVGITLGVVGLAYYFFIYRKKGSDNPNFEDLQTNMGIKANKDNVVVAPFNKGENLAQFYTNNRVIIFNKNKNVILKGSYSNGGTSITLDNGKEISGGSVWQNLLKTLGNASSKEILSSNTNQGVNYKSDIGKI